MCSSTTRLCSRSPTRQPAQRTSPWIALCSASSSSGSWWLPPVELVGAVLDPVRPRNQHLPAAGGDLPVRGVAVEQLAAGRRSTARRPPPTSTTTARWSPWAISICSPEASHDTTGYPGTGRTGGAWPAAARRRRTRRPSQQRRAPRSRRSWAARRRRPAAGRRRRPRSRTRAGRRRSRRPRPRPRREASSFWPKLIVSGRSAEHPSPASPKASTPDARARRRAAARSARTPRRAGTGGSGTSRVPGPALERGEEDPSDASPSPRTP